MNKVVACVLVAVSLCVSAPLIEKDGDKVDRGREVFSSAVKVAANGGMAAWGWSARGRHPDAVYIDVLAVYFTLRSALEGVGLGGNIALAVREKRGDRND